MARYRCYFLDPEYHIASWQVLDLASDDLARSEADRLWKLSPNHAVELWNGTHMVHRDVKVAV